MKDVTFGVKVPEDLRDEINEIMKASGLVGREFMQELVDSYMLDRNKQQIPEMSEEIKELQSLTHRINEMYLYLGTRFQGIIESKAKETQDINIEIDDGKKEYERQIEVYEEKIKMLEGEKLKVEEEINIAEIKHKDFNIKINEITGYNENYQELNKQYKSNIEKLTIEVDELKSLKNINRELVKDNNQLQENNDNLASELWFSKREVEKLNKQLFKNKEDYKNNTSRLREQHHLEKQTAILELQLENQKAIEALNSKAANMQEEYNDKLKQLLFNMNNKELEGDGHGHRNNTTN